MQVGLLMTLFFKVEVQMWRFTFPFVLAILLQVNRHNINCPDLWEIFSLYLDFCLSSP
jgi:hypothetical protein